MPRGVLSWLRCTLCGRSPAVEECSGWRWGPLCAYCAEALRGLGLCGAGPRRAVPVARSLDVDERLLETLRSRSRARGRARRGSSR